MPPEIDSQSMASKQPQQTQQQLKNSSKVSLEPAKRTIVPIVPSKMIIHPVSNLDSILGNFYLHTVYFFERSSDQRIQSWEKEKDELNYSLAKALDWFPILSGRLRMVESGNLGIKSNDAGVRLTEATSECTLRDWLDDTDGFLHRDVFPEVRITDYSVSPLLTIQYTRFRCGSLAVGLSFCHLLADLKSLNLFFNFWGHFNHEGFHRDSSKVPPAPTFHAEKTEHNLPPELLTAEEGLDINMKVSHELDSHVFHFASNTVEKLTRESGCSEVDGLCAFLWKSVAKAQQLGAESSRLCLWSNSSSENSTYFGNAASVFKFVDSAPTGLATQSIKEVAKCIQLGAKVNGSSHTSLFSRNVLFCNWAAEVPFYKTGFGFSSRPSYVECCTTPLLGEGTVTVFPASDAGRGKSVCVSLRRDAMKRLLHDKDFVSSTTSRQCKPSSITSAPAA